MKKIALILLCGLTIGAWADAPVVDLNSQGTVEQTTPSHSQQPQMNNSQQHATAPNANSDNAKQVPEQKYVQAPAPQPGMSNSQLIMRSQSILLGQMQTMQQNMQKMQGLIDMLSHRLDMQQQANAKSKSTTTNSTSASNSVSTSNGSGSLATASASTANDAKAKTVYDAAYAELKDQKFTNAAQDFKQFLHDFPNSTYAPNAYYWLGQIELIAGNTDDGIKDLKTVVSKYPMHPKAGDALLKLGYLYYDKQQWALAAKSFEQVQSKFPDSNAASLAGQKLDAMKKEGHTS